MEDSNYELYYVKCSINKEAHDLGELLKNIEHYSTLEGEWELNHLIDEAKDNFNGEI